MPAVNRSALVPYRASEMYALVSDIGAYGEFLPWCAGTEILSRDADEVVASIQIAYGSLNKAFTTRNRLQKDKMMEMRLVEGPFKHLHGYWRFEDLGGEGSKISLDLDFQFSSRMVGMMIGPVFTRIADGLVDAFRVRAEALYGRR
jgi:ribosome-associated toxin RatA of RatAB toxin-antitoxin module